jgi:glycosyltransferase involved in cell wall biosynthesis
MTTPVERARVLFLAHHFPPIGGVVGRNVATARHLPEFGYEPTVLTGPGDASNRWAPRDERLLERVVPAGVTRVPGPVPGPRTGLAARLARWTERPAPWVSWWVQSAIEAGRRLDGSFDVILANLIPYETAEAASVLSRELGIPWVADLEDPWALDEMRVHPTFVNHAIDRRRMFRGLDSASALIMSCAEAAARVRERLPRWSDKLVTAIPHGFTGEDYAGPRPERSDDAFRIVHTGALHTELGRDHRRTHRLRKLLGGTSLDMDILTRSHVYLLEAIERVRREHPELGRRIELHLAGGLTAADREVAEPHAYVHSYGQLEHSATVELARGADLLFVPMHELPEGTAATIVPCKTYEYLASGPPILAAVSDGDARDLLRGFERASVCRPSDVTAMAEAIARWIREPAPGREHADADYLRTYERRYLTGEIAGVLDAVLSRAPASAGHANAA